MSAFERILKLHLVLYRIVSYRIVSTNAQWHPLARVKRQPVLALPVFTARRYASAGTSHGPGSVCLSQVETIKKTERIELVLAWEHHSTHPPLC